MKQILIVLVSISLIACSAGKQSPLPEKWERGDYSQLSQVFPALAKKQMRKSLVKGVSIALVDDQQTIWATGFGSADVKAKQPADENSVYRFGSITKLFTMTAIMDLVEQGLIDLNAPLQTYLPELQVNSHAGVADTLRVHHLLTHHSGLPGDRLAGFGFYKPLDSDYQSFYLEMPELLSNDYTQFGPDSLFSYCNNGFTLLGVIIQRVTGRDYSEYMQQEVLEPLGMSSSSLLMTPALEEKTAQGYMLNRPKDMPYIRDLPAGSLLSNTSDMANFMKMFFNEGVTVTGDTLLEPETIVDIFTPKNAHVPLDKNFQIGWTFWLLNPYEHTFLQTPAGHGGDLPPFHAIMVVLPGEKLGVTAVTNSNTGSAVVMQLAMDLLKAAYEIKTGESIEYRQTAEKAAYSQDRYEYLDGYYPGILGLSHVKAEKNQLMMKGGGLSLGLIPHDDGWFSMKFKLFGFIPVPISSLKPIRVNFFQHGEGVFMEATMNGVSTGVTSRITPVEITPTWLKRVGKYERVDLKQAFTKQQLSYNFDKVSLVLDKQSGFLILQGILFGSKTQLPLEPLDDHTAVVMGVGRMAGQTIHISQGESGELLHWSGMALKLKQ